MCCLEQTLKVNDFTVSIKFLNIVFDEDEIRIEICKRGCKNTKNLTLFG